jgi:hypothetical protein
MCGATRPSRILLAIDGQEFVSNAELLLHEYFHVIRQWGTGRLTRWRYLLESTRCQFVTNEGRRHSGFHGVGVDRWRADRQAHYNCASIHSNYNPWSQL